MDAQSLKRAGTLIFLGVGEFVLFFALAEIYYPGYDVSSQAISDLGATCVKGACRFVEPSASIFDLSIIFLGLMLLAAAYYMRRGVGSKALPFFIGVAGVGAIGVGVFNESYGFHSLFSALTFIGAGIEALLVYKVARAPFSYFSAFTGLVTLAATVLYASGTYLGLGQGGMERMVVYPALISGLAFGGYLMALGDSNRS